MDCYKPLKIKNQYTDEWLHVPCRNCDACLISQANLKAYELSVTLAKYKFCYFVTLTYSNDYVPYVLKGMDYVFRGQGDEVEIIDDIPENINWNENNKYLVNHGVPGAIGVLYYRDFCLFLKRFRKYILKNYGKREFKYFQIGEYGSFYGRPHAHIVIMSDELLFEECKNACFESWKMHDWSRFWKNGENEACKRCGKDCASYVSSYVNCCSNSVPISNYKCFRQKTVRSKNLGFGLDKEIFKTYKEDVIRVFNGIFYDGNRKVFQYLSNKQVDDVSFKLVSCRYISTYFHKFKGWNKISIVSKCACASRIVEIADSLLCRNLPLNTVVNGKELSSLDLSFYRSYKRFLISFCTYVPYGSGHGFYVLNGVEFTLYDYVFLMDKILSFYKCLLLEKQMKTYEVLGSDEYFLSLLDTKVESSDSARLVFLRKYLSNKFFRGLKRSFDINCSPFHKNDLDCKVRRYKSRLLPKHLNDVSNLLSYH